MALYNQHVCPVDNWCVLSFILYQTSAFVYSHASRVDVVCHYFPVSLLHQISDQIACEGTFNVHAASVTIIRGNGRG